MFKCLTIKNCRICISVKVMYLIAFSFSVCFLLLLNIMMHQLAVTSESSVVEPKEYSVNEKKFKQTEEPEAQNSKDNYTESNRLAWPDKKPKTSNDKVLNEDQNKVNGEQQKSETVTENNMELQSKQFNAVKSLQSLNVQDKGVSDKNADKTAVTQKSKEERNVFENDIKKLVIKQRDEVSDHVPGDLGSDNCFRKEDNSRTLHVDLEHGSVKYNPVESLVVDGIYWSKNAEALVPKGMTKDEVTKWIRTVRNGKIKNLQPPSWERCGRPKNGFIVMKDGIQLCARYQHPQNRFLLDEVLSFYLSLLLRMDNVPAVLLSEVNNASSQWQGIDPSKLDWQQHQYVALIQWIDHLDHYTNSYVQIPSTLFEMYKTGDSLDCYMLKKQNLQPEEISSIIQWGSMIIFDYLTGNYDRVASMQDGAEEQHSQSVIQEFIRNLRKSAKTGKFWLIDNESGMLEGYHLMYRSFDHGEKFVRFHTEMLQTLCLFERPVVEAVKNLHRSEQPHEVLEEFTRKYEPLYDKVPIEPMENVFSLMFSKRLSDVVEWIKHCESRVKR